MDEKTNNKKVLLYGLVFAGLYALVFVELIQGFIAWITGASGVSFRISGIKLYAGFILNGGAVINAVIFIVPYILTILAIELAMRLLKKYPQGFKRHFIIVFSLVLSGFLLFDTFYGAFSVILRFNFENDWVQLVNMLNITEGERLISALFVIILTAGYLNLSTKRIIKYINIH
jgi:hypothetical protein